MKRASSYVLAFFLATGLALAQVGSGARKASTELNPQPLPPGRKIQMQSKTNASSEKAYKADKGGKKSGEGAGTTSTTKSSK